MRQLSRKQNVTMDGEIQKEIERMKDIKRIREVILYKVLLKEGISGVQKKLIQQRCKKEMYEEVLKLLNIRLPFEALSLNLKYFITKCKIEIIKSKLQKVKWDIELFEGNLNTLKHMESHTHFNYLFDENAIPHTQKCSYVCTDPKEVPDMLHNIFNQNHDS